MSASQTSTEYSTDEEEIAQAVEKAEDLKAARDLDQLLTYYDQERPKKRLRRFVNGKKYVMFSDLTKEQQANILNRQDRERLEGLWWEQADKEASLIELRYLRSKVAGDYEWDPESGWHLVAPKPVPRNRFLATGLDTTVRGTKRKQSISD